MTMPSMIQNNQSTTKLINELKNSSKQYPPLNKQQERELIEQYKDDRETLNKLLYMHNVRLAFNMAKKYATKTNDFDSLVSDCLFGLSIACQRFDINRGIKFSTYATSWIFKYAVSSFYQKPIDKATVSLNATLVNVKQNKNDVTLENYVNEHIHPLANVGQSIEQQLSASERTQLCNTLIGAMEVDTSLSAVDKAVFIDYFYNREKTRDIASKYNLTVQDISHIRGKILQKFRNMLENEYNINSYHNDLA